MAHKRVRVLFSRRAERDLHEIYHYLSVHAPSVLGQVDQKIFKVLRRLEQFPQSGHWVKEFSGKRYREILVYHYRLIYRYLEKRNRVQILTLRHGKRFLPSFPDTAAGRE